jgi:SAM-dependent methyltransferase
VTATSSKQQTTPTQPPAAGLAGNLRRSTPRTARSAEVYDEQFGPASRAALVLDVGAGDATWAARRLDQRSLAVRCDPLYALQPPAQPGLAVAGAGQRLPFVSSRFDRVICSWVTPHVPRPELAGFLNELVRVTKPGGTVLVHPLYHVVRHLVSPHDFVYEKKFSKQRPGTTLVMVKRPEVSDEDWVSITAEVAESAKLHLSRPLTALRKLAQRRVIRKAGTNQLGSSIFPHLTPGVPSPVGDRRVAGDGPPSSTPSR